ncbi:GGDEF domain-containing response regulator [Chromobacterium sphagni]|uniref:diguanylate cyclase n=1 Tax=Chromobacterium sphagni TaxID=1903179 RepID=A0A1S1X0T5_9NEIS|nr:diguanylate cyclase [Chromobacterium sphagni]OHX13134.1 diguanylate cyclase response regulator [Chromobacterium sphagni]OHX21068.1 diguanylate cyclase response regulator [Chromobacterium sphagni]
MNDDIPSPTSGSQGCRRGRILIVDDQPTNIVVAHQILHPLHEVFMATNGEQAIAFCQNTPPDLLLLDVEMPGMNGMEVCRLLKQWPDTRDIPVIFVTGLQSQEQEMACWEAGAVDFVTKPVTPATLRNRVHAHLTLKFQADQLRELAFTDSLTGIANRRLFNERLDREWRHCQRHRASLALILSDIDHFKKYNDRYGNLSGDECLQQVAHTLQLQLNRPYDLAARLGGEEFACLLPETSLAGAVSVAIKMEAAIRALHIEHADSAAADVVTLSLGVATVEPDADNNSQHLIQLADDQLYLAKKTGRARVCAV